MNWKDVMREEMNVLEKNYTWEIVELSKGEKNYRMQVDFLIKI